MYYSAQNGVRDTWRDNIQTITSEFRQHNWLPAAVGAVMISWIALIVMGLQQTILVNPQVPDNTQVGSSPGRTLDVTNTATVTSTPSPSPSNAVSSSLFSGTMTMQAQTNQQIADASNIVTETTDIIGGRGADEPTTPAVTNPIDETPVVPPVVTVPVDPPSDGGGGGVIVVDPPELPIVDLPPVEVPLPEIDLPLLP